MDKIDTILLCGGRGTRLHEVTGDTIPKSLHKVEGRELLDYTLETLDFKHIDKIIFAVDHHAEAIREWVDSREIPCRVIFSEQSTPGVLGAVDSAMEHVETERFIVCNTDEIRLGLSFTDLLATHIEEPRLMACMAATNTDHLYRHRALKIDETGKVTSSELKGVTYVQDPNQNGPVNVGFILFEREAASHFSSEHGRDWGAIIDPLTHKGLVKAAVMGINYFNVGTRDELTAAETYLATVTQTP
mgnify:CR=1 FL=1